jgi:hypothetical protein
MQRKELQTFTSGSSQHISLEESITDFGRDYRSSPRSRGKYYRFVFPEDWIVIASVIHLKGDLQTNAKRPT